MTTAGLTGNFGMGKSTVLALFKALGARTFSADIFVHKLLEHRTVMKKIARLLGNDVLRGTPGTIALDRKRVADIIFRDPQKRKSLEAILHPEVSRAIGKSISGSAGKKAGTAVIVEVPLLFEAGYDSSFDKTIVVYCSRNTALKRLVQKGVSREEALMRMKAQMGIAGKRKLCDYGINNNNGIEKTKARVERIYRELTAC